MHAKKVFIEELWYVTMCVVKNVKQNNPERKT